MNVQATERTYDLRWLDQRADTMHMMMKQNVDVAGSQAQLSFPLLDWPLTPSLPLSVSATYSSSFETPKNGLLGTGWSLNHPLDFIIVDHKEGIFPTTFEYILMINSQIEQLIPIPNSTSIHGVSKFRLATDDDTPPKLEITYDEPNERWTIESKNILTVFGRSPNSALVGDTIQETLHWKNWRGFGYSENNLDSLQNAAQAWYLISREEKNGYKTKLLYDYLIEEGSLLNGKNYTALVQLKSLRTESTETDSSIRLDFHYGEKGRNEYHVQSPKTSHGYYRFPLFLQSKLFLEGFTFQVGKNTRQQIRMEYETQGKVRLLTGINQLYHEGYIEPLVRFFYGEHPEGTKKRHLMSEARHIVGEQNAIKYFYKQLQIPKLDFGPELNTREYLTTQNMQVKIGEKYSVIAHHEGSTVVKIRILNKELTTSIATLEVDVHTDDEIAGEKIDEFEVIMYSHLLGVIVTSKAEDENTEGRQYLALFLKNTNGDDGKWSETPVFFGSYPKQDLFRFSTKIMLLARQSGVIEIFEPNEVSENGFKNYIVPVSSLSIRRCVIQEYIVLAFDGQYLFTVTKNSDSNNWCKNSNFAEVTSDELEFEANVSMPELLVNTINSEITKFGLQMYKNVVLFSKLSWENETFSCKVNLYLLDELYENYKVETFISGGEPANKSIHEYERIVENDGNTFTFRYKLVNSKYKFQLVELSGNVREDMLAACKVANGGICPESGLEMIEKEIEKLIKNMNVEQDHIFRDITLFDLSPCWTYRLDGSGAVTNSSIIHMQGDSWAQEWVENPTNFTSTAIQSTFILESTQNQNGTDFWLFSQNPENGGKEGEPIEIFSIGIKGKIAIGYPSYIAYQLSELEPIVIIPIVGNGTGEKIEVRGQQLLGMSTTNTLLTYETFDNPNGYPKNTRVFARRINSLIRSQPFNVLERCEVIAENGDVVRSTEYENEFTSNITTIQQENVVRIIPTGNMSYSGTYEEITVVPLEVPSHATKTQRWVDTEGRVVRSEVLDFSKEISASKPANEFHNLFDLSGNLKITDIFPYNLTQNMFVYYGFETYEELSLFGSNLKFDEDNVVVEDGNSMTGKSLVRLQEGNTLSLNISPSEQSRSYTASCWMRPKKYIGPIEFEYDSPVTFFTANLNLQSEDSKDPFLTIYGQMKKQVDDWLYVELTTDFGKIRNNYYAEFYQHNIESGILNGVPSPVVSNFTISIIIESSQGMQIEVDHVKFWPTGSDLNIKVYNMIGQETETILGNGVILRRLYHEISGKEIAQIYEDGEVGMLRSGSKSGTLFPGDSNSTVGAGVNSEIVLLPESGSYERFSLFQFESGRWETDKLSHWEMTGAGKIAHVGVNLITELKVGNPEEMFGNGVASSALSFYLKFSSDVDLISLQILLGNSSYPLIEIKSLRSTYAYSLVINGNSTVTHSVPCHGQLVIFVENQTMWLWYDGVLLHEGRTGVINPWSNFVINAKGLLSITNMIILNKPQVMQTFFNAFGQRTQMLRLESENEIRISELIHDEIGRESIKTKTGLLVRKGSEPILKYYADLVTNKNASHPNYILKTGIVEGLLAEMHPIDEGYSYGRTFYMNDLTGEVSIKGYPGKDFLKGGKFIKEFSRDSDITFLHDLYPPHEGFTQKVIKEPNVKIQVAIFDLKGREVGSYVQLPGFSHILTTFEFDDAGNLLKILPPNYHEQVQSFSGKAPSKRKINAVEMHWEEKLGTFFTYNKDHQMTSKKTPDIEGWKKYLYDSWGNLRFFYTVDVDGESEIAKNIIYILHSGTKEPVEVGYIKGEIPVEQLYQFQNSTEIPIAEKQVYQHIVYSDSHSDPSLRGRTKLLMTYNIDEIEQVSSDNDQPYTELLKFDSNRNLILKTINIASGRVQQSNALTSIRKHYKAGKLIELQYPEEVEVDIPLTLILSYDRSGHLSALGTIENPTQFASFTYSGSGSLIGESIEPGSRFEVSRFFEYNSPGLLTKISDPFLSQTLSFDESGYGQIGYGDGTVMSTQFEAHWAKNASMYDMRLLAQWFSVPVQDYSNQETMAMCLRALERLKFLDKFYAIPQMFLGHAELFLLPLSCRNSTGYELMKLLGAKLPPIKEYGHSFSYGNYKELTKSKFFAGNQTIPTPLQANTFYKELPSLVENSEESERIWNLLITGGFVTVDNVNVEDKLAAIGKEGINPIFRYDQLHSDLDEIVYYPEKYYRPILHLLFQLICEGEPIINLSTFQQTYVTWLGYTDNPLTPIDLITRAEQEAQQIYEMLGDKGYISKDINFILDENFMVAMSPFQSYVTEIACVLRQHFITQLGLGINDYEAIDFDSNGNHKVYFVGLNKHSLEYSENTNKVLTLSVQKPFAPTGEDTTVFDLEHNSQGNVYKAKHRNIEYIRYHPVSNRPMYMLLSDGRKLTFKYDAQGERIVKRVYDSDDILFSEVTYMRDETGRVMRDVRAKFIDGTSVITTTYIYGPRGLLGFIRGSKFFSVFTDHAGSIRLITQEGKVKAGYDYWPYGASMREFGEEATHIYYRYTGQEYDEETGLYSFNARLYDPLLGRFYQPDQKSQFASPYVFAGNYPVPMVDPDEDLADVMLFNAQATIENYLKDGTGSNNWDLTKWDWTDFKTYFALVGGAAVPWNNPPLKDRSAVGYGAASAVGLEGSFVRKGLEFGWNPLMWDWSSPVIYNGFFTGLKADATNMSSMLALRETGGLLKTGQLNALLKGPVNGIGNAYLEGAIANADILLLLWKWNCRETWKALRNGFLSGSRAPIGYLEKLEKFLETVESIEGFSRNEKRNMLTRLAMLNKDILRNKNHLLFNSFGESLVRELRENGESNQLSSTNTMKIDRMAMSTFEGVIDGMMEEPGLLKMIYEFRNAELNRSQDKLLEKKCFEGTITNSSTNASNVYSNFYKNKFDSKPVSSSASRLSPMRILGYLRDSFSSFIFGKPNPSGYAESHDNRQNCQQGAWLDGSYNMDGLTCYMKGSRVLVFPKHEHNDVITHKNGNFPKLPLLGDAYTKSTCDSVEFNGTPSISCKGERSAFIYTPYHQERLFDNLDSNILLGRVLVHLGSKIVGRGDYGEPIKTESGFSEISYETIKKWKGMMNKIERMMADQNNDDVKWAQYLLEDCKEMCAEVECNLKKSKQSYKFNFELGQLEERLCSLYDDLEEQVQYSSRTHDISEPHCGFDCHNSKNLNEFIAQNVAQNMKNGLWVKNANNMK